MRVRHRTVILGLALVILWPHVAPCAPVSEWTERLDPRAAIAESEGALGRTVGPYELRDAAGARLPLRDYVGKPLVVSLVYTACSSICPATTQHLMQAVNEASRVFGSDAFNVLTVGFDARNDTPARLTQFASAQGIHSTNWKLASAEPSTLKLLLRDLGFSYRAAAGGFNHVTQTTIIDRQGKVYRQVYGDDFPLQMFIEPLKDVIYGTTQQFSVTGLIDRVKFICTVYDPGKGHYRTDYGLAFGSVITALSLLVFGGLIYREWHRGRPA